VKLLHIAVSYNEVVVAGDVEGEYTEYIVRLKVV